MVTFVWQPVAPVCRKSPAPAAPPNRCSGLRNRARDVRRRATRAHAPPSPRAHHWPTDSVTLGQRHMCGMAVEHRKPDLCQSLSSLVGGLLDLSFLSWRK